MKRSLLVLVAAALLASLAFATVAVAAPKSKPVEFTLEIVQGMIADAVASLQVQIDALAARLGVVETQRASDASRITALEAQLAELREDMGLPSSVIDTFALTVDSAGVYSGPWTPLGKAAVFAQVSAPVVAEGGAPADGGTVPPAAQVFGVLHLPAGDRFMFAGGKTLEWEIDITELPADGSDFTLDVHAYYMGKTASATYTFSGWRFEGRQAGGAVSLTPEPGKYSAPKVAGDRVVWLQQQDSDGWPVLWDVYSWTPTEGVTRLNDDTSSAHYDAMGGDYGPQVSESRVFWRGLSGIFTWTPQDGVVSVPGSSGAYPPAASGDRVVWWRYTQAGTELYTWTPTEGTTLAGNSDYGQIMDLAVSGDRAAWQANGEILTWTPTGGVQHLTSTDAYDHFLRISGDRLAWQTTVQVSGSLAEQVIYTWTPSDGISEVLRQTNPYRITRFSLDGDEILLASDGYAFPQLSLWSPLQGIQELFSMGGGSSIGEITYREDMTVLSMESEFSDDAGMGQLQALYVWTADDGIRRISNGVTKRQASTDGDHVVWCEAVEPMNPWKSGYNVMLWTR